MSKFRMELELQGLKIKIEGSRDDVPIIGRNISEQISGMLKPAIQIVESEYQSEAEVGIAKGALVDDSFKKKSKRRTKPSLNVGDKPNAIEFRHDPAKFGTPTQNWTTSQKAVWLLYVVKEHVGIPELSTGQVVSLFNTHFRQSKIVTNSNVSRDLGKLKIASPSLVGEDNSKSPAAWFLTDEGIRNAQKMIAELLASRVP